MRTRRDFLKSVGSAALMTLAPVSRGAKLRDKPNIVLVLAEDICPDLACYGTPMVQTPNLDRLAAEGARHTHAYVTSPVCSPSRSAMMTGMYQTSIGAHHHRSHRGDGYRLPAPVKPITHYLCQAGYYTACGGKTDLNFHADRVFNGKNRKDRGPGQPFFAQITIPVTHRPFRRNKEHPVDPRKVEIPPYYPDHPLVRRDWADYLESIQVMDRQVGKLLREIESEGIADRTVVIFLGDNGRCHVRGKQWLYEGGIHIPLIVRWPGRIKPGQISDELVSAIDVSAAIQGAAGVAVPAHLQGRDFLRPAAARRAYVFAARDRCDGTVDRIRCVRSERYKYIRNYMPERPYTQFNAYKTHQYPVLALMQVLHERGKLTSAQARFMAPRKPEEELYDLADDPHETRNLASAPAHQSALHELRRALAEWSKTTGDQGERPEAESVVDREIARMRSAHERNMKRKGLSLDAAPEKLLAYWEKRVLSE